MELKNILETLIFISGRPVGTSEMVEALKSVPDGPQPTSEELEAALDSLQQDWESRSSGVCLVKISHGYEFRSAPDCAAWIRALNRPKPQKLSLPAVETLAMIAYRQPITRTDIEDVRGVDSGGVLKSLTDRRLIRIVGRKEEAGRPLLYATTKEFLEFFGLKDLADLPPLQEFEEMMKTQTTESDKSENELFVADLMMTPEEMGLLEDGDRETLDELDESLKGLKDLEKTFLVHENQEAAAQALEGSLEEDVNTKPALSIVDPV